MTSIDTLISKILAGDQDQFRWVIRDVTPILRSFFSSRVYDGSQIDDLCQETLLGVYQDLNKFDQTKNFRNWVLGHASNKLKMYYRGLHTRSQAHQVLQDEVQDQVLPLLSPLEDKEHHSKQVTQLNSCLEKLNERLRGVLKDRYFSRLKVQDMASQYSLTETAISSLLYRGKKILQQCMGTA